MKVDQMVDEIHSYLGNPLPIVKNPMLFQLFICSTGTVTNYEKSRKIQGSENDINY